MKVVTFGEVMLRLAPENYLRFIQSEKYEATFGGAEANVAVSLANYGVDAAFVSKLPTHEIGQAAVNSLRKFGVDTSKIVRGGNRVGIYYCEKGASQRPSKVIYDRKHSAMAEYDFSDVDLSALLDGFDWLHLSGITPALGENCAQLTLDLLRVAKEKNMTVSFDGNFRSALWTWEQARDFCTQCLPYVDILLGIEPYHLWKDESDHSKGDWKDGVPLQPSYEEQDEVFQHFVERYPNLKCIARHVRYAHSGSENSLKAFMWYDGHTFESKLFTFTPKASSTAFLISTLPAVLATSKTYFLSAEPDMARSVMIGRMMIS